MNGVNQEPVDTFIQIAQVWSGLLGHEVTPREVALCLAGAKMVNAVIRPDEPSSYEDAHGFLSMSERIVFDSRLQYTPAQANADQSKFYAENDRTIDAGPDEDEDLDEPVPYVLRDEHGSSISMVAMCNCSMPDVQPDGSCRRCGMPT